MSMDAPALRLELRDSDENHNKFWEITQPRECGKLWLVDCRWGRIGTRGQEREFLFATLGSAQKFHAQKVREKIRKGYAAIPNGGTLALRAGTAPHSVAPASSDAETLASDNAVIRHNYIESLPPLDPSDPFKLPWE